MGNVGSKIEAGESIVEAKVEKGSKLADFLFGSVSGFAGKLVEFPFDTIKVRLQTQPISADGVLVFQGPWQCFKHAVSTQGFMSLYKGLSAPLVGAMIENSALFVAYNHIQKLIKTYTAKDPSKDEPLSLPQLALAGFLSGAVVSFVLTPVELVKCKLQVQDLNMPVTAHSPPYRGPISIISHTLREYGFRGMYRGHMGTFLRESGGGAAWFGTYELAVRHFIESSRNPAVKHKDDLSTWQLMAAGALAGMAFNASLFPADVIKSRQQTAEGGSASFWAVGKQLYKAQGLAGFYRGCGITVARSAPTSAVIFATFELLTRHCKIGV
ncbi:hypothetical protein HK104_003901 [Borealophlyctis nickersoniae]|nr:hypothetical protein HK104_003901 [Borealophlyctis nickersoniae]